MDGMQGRDEVRQGPLVAAVHVHVHFSKYLRAWVWEIEAGIRGDHRWLRFTVHACREFATIVPSSSVSTVTKPVCFGGHPRLASVAVFEKNPTGQGRNVPVVHPLHTQERI